jgi:hypothetical protein
MTQPEFLAHAQLNPSQVNIWYSDLGAPYTLYAITIPVFDSTSPTPVNNSIQLEATQQITIPLSVGESIHLTVVSRVKYTSPDIIIIDPNGFSTITLGQSYYYFTIEPKVVQSVVGITILGDQLIFAPQINQAEYSASPYNTSKGNIQINRPSENIMTSDRYKVGTLENPTYTGPLNIIELLSGSAEKAGVQDSNYSNTAWINGRYSGTKTSRLTYGTEPAISGRTFQGTEFPKDASVSEVGFSVSTQQAIYKDYFYAGVGDTPGLQAETTDYSLTSLDAPSIFNISLTTTAQYTIPPQAGDLWRIAGEQEIFKIEAIGTVSGQTNTFQWYVTRAWNGVTSTTSGGVSLERVKLVQVFILENDKLSGVPKGQVYVKETGASLRLDTSGYVVSSSQVIAF